MSKIRITNFFLLLFVTIQAIGQSFNYQAVVRDISGTILVNQSIGVKINLLQGSVTGISVYEETHTVTSNPQGIITLKIGNGTTVNNFSNIDWSTQDYWLKVALDVTGGTTYTEVGTSSIVSVPYANYAVNGPDADPTNEIELPAGGIEGQVLTTDGAGTYTWTSKSLADNLGNHTATQNIDVNNNNITGVNIVSTGTVISTAVNESAHTASLNGKEGIVLPGTTSDYSISVQDGNGRIQHKWNATYGTNETYIVGGEDAAFIDFNATASDNNTAWIEFKHADGANATAGDPISWNTQMIINQGGEVGINETSPDDKLHVTDAGNGTRVRVENSSNGWAGIVSKNTLREVFVGVQGAFDHTPGEFHIFDNTAGARRMVIDAQGNVGFGRNNPSVKLDVNGSVNCTGGTCSSDIRWKKGVKKINNVLNNLKKIRGVTYFWRTNEFSNKEFTKEKQIGVIAQEVEKVYPELVKTDNDGFKSMDYMSLTAVLLEGIKEQQKNIEKLEEKVAGSKSFEKRLKLLENVLLNKNQIITKNNNN